MRGRDAASGRRRVSEARVWRAGSPRSLAFGGAAAARARALPAHGARADALHAAPEGARAGGAARTPHEVVYWNAGYAVPRADPAAARRRGDARQHAARGALGARSSPARRPTFDWLADVDALKVAFPQDEYNHAHVLDDWLADLGVDVVFSIYGAEHRDLLYPRLRARGALRAALTGYVDEHDVTRQAAVRAAARPPAARPGVPRPGADAALRPPGPAQARASPRRWRRRRARRACASTSRPTRRDAILGDRWFPFVASTRAVLGSESGASASTAAASSSRPSGRCWPSGPTSPSRTSTPRSRRAGTACAAATIGPRHLEAAAAQHLPGAGRGPLRRRAGARRALPARCGRPRRRRRGGRAPGRPPPGRGARPSAPTPTSCSAAATATPRSPRAWSRCWTRSDRAAIGRRQRLAAPGAGRRGRPTDAASCGRRAGRTRAVDRVAPDATRRLDARARPLVRAAAPGTGGRSARRAAGAAAA